MPCTVILDTPERMIRRSKLRLKGLNRGAVPGGEHQSGVDPGLACPHALGILLLAAQLVGQDLGVERLRQGHICHNARQKALSGDPP